MAVKEIRFFEFLMSIQLVLTLFKDINPEAIEEMGWLKSLDEMYLLHTGAFLFFLMMNMRHEGSRLSILFVLPAKLFLYLSKITEYQYNILTLLTTILACGVCFIFYTFPVFKFPKYQGQFQVGVKDIKADGVDVRLFYPSDAKQRGEIKCITDKELRQNFKIMQNCPKPLNVPKFVPYFIFDLIMQVYKKKTFNGTMNAKIIRIPNEKFPFILFSHGLAAHSSHFTCLLGDLASKGCFVGSIQHDDLLELQETPNFKDWPLQMKPKFEKRVEEYTKVLQFFKKQENINQIFGYTTVKLDYEHTIAMGHSFGGVTALYSTLKNEEDIFSTILLDPAMAVLNFEEGKKFTEANKLKKPCLILNSEQFDKTLPDIKQMENIKKFIEINKDNTSQILNCLLKGTGHENFGDLQFSLGRELEMKKLIGKREKITVQMVLLQKLIEIFMMETILADSKEFDKQEVLKKYDDICVQVKQENNIVDLDKPEKEKKD